MRRVLVPLAGRSARHFVVTTSRLPFAVLLMTTERLLSFVRFVGDRGFIFPQCVPLVTVVTRRAADGRPLGRNIQCGYMWRYG